MEADLLSKANYWFQHRIRQEANAPIMLAADNDLSDKSTD
jgi:hypothetical protein